MLRLFLISVLLFFQTISYGNETNSNINQDDPYYQIGWKNLLNPIEKVVNIPGANASIGIIPDEIYLDEKDTIIKYEEYLYSSSSGDDAPILILTDREDFYTIKVEYNDSGYVDMCLMSMCTDFIISNSTFSWWAAWLGNKGKVIAPKNWFPDDKDTSDLYCDGWEVI